jgi:hypothetical protein
MGDAVATIHGNKNVIQTTGGTIASIGLEQSGKKIAGVLVTPATWTLNYVADGSKPSAVDLGIWASGFLSAPAAIVTGFLKAAVDDDINRKLALIQAKEPSKSARFIKACYNFGAAPPAINAMTIANSGGTAWITSVGLWVYITDARDRLVADYVPKEFVTLYRPCKPYRALSTGGFDWEVIRK